MVMSGRTTTGCGSISPPTRAPRKVRVSRSCWYDCSAALWRNQPIAISQMPEIGVRKARKIPPMMKR